MFRFILRCSRTKKLDLNSFAVEIDNGKAFVTCDPYEVQILAITCDAHGEEKRVRFAGAAVAATNWLERRNAKLDTIEQ